jgi:hypothetical protein
MRKKSSRTGEDLIIVGFSGLFYLVNPSPEELSEINPDDLESYGPYKIAKELVFPDEMKDPTTGNKHG